MVYEAVLTNDYIGFHHRVGSNIAAFSHFYIFMNDHIGAYHYRIMKLSLWMSSLSRAKLFFISW